MPFTIATRNINSVRLRADLVVRLLTEEAKDDLAEVRTPGEIVLLRTVLPDGSVLEPVAAMGKQSFVMPGVEPGVFTEYAFVMEHAQAGGRLIDQVDRFIRQETNCNISLGKFY